MKRCRLAVVATLAVGLVVAPALAQVDGVRSLPPGCRVGGQVVVGLDLQVGAEAPNGVIVVERLPAGWTLSSATPPPNSYNTATRELRWVFYGGAVNDQALDIQYTVVAGAEAVPFEGTILFNDPSGTAQVSAIRGDSTCPVAVSCAGDCDGNRTVTIDEVIRQIAIGLGGAVVEDCSAGDANGDGTITVEEVVTAVNNALNGCP